MSIRNPGSPESLANPLDVVLRDIRAGAIDTVLVAFPDMQGRLTGKRFTGRFFADTVAAHGAEACNYLLAVDVENNTVDGYAISGWERGYGDMRLVLDPATACVLPWLTATALVLADIETTTGEPVAPAPRSALARQRARLAEHGWQAYAGTELEFLLFHDTFTEAWNSGYRSLTPASTYNIDYAVLASTRVEGVLRAIRNGMDGAGLYCEGSKGECNLGQHEIAFRFDEAQTTCDHHTIFKNGAKEIAEQHGYSLTFMAKFNEREGNSCHIHLSLRDNDGAAIFADPNDPLGMSALFRHFVAGQIACLNEFSLLYAPNINSYKRYVPGSFAPTAISWGTDNRTCALRVVGAGAGMRVENRVPGGDVNPYLAIAGMIAAGLHGIEQQLPLGPAETGNAYVADVPRVPTTLREAADRFEQSAIARAAFGDDVVDHYVHAARIEVAAFDATITDWEKFRGFERL